MSTAIVKNKQKKTDNKQQTICQQIWHLYKYSKMFINAIDLALVLEFKSLFYK